MGNSATKEHDGEEEEEYEEDSQYSYYSGSDHSVYSYEDESELNSIGRKAEKEGPKDTATTADQKDGNDENTAKEPEIESNEKTVPTDETIDPQQENETTKDETVQQDQSREKNNLSEEAITISSGVAHVNLKALSEDDLQKRLQLIDISRESILQASQALMTSGDEFPSFYYNSDQLSNSNDSAWERNTALVLLGVSTELRTLRFKMVPSRISESKFWLSIFHLIENGTAVVQAEETTKEDKSVVEEPLIDNSSQEPTTTPPKLDKDQEIQKLKDRLINTEKELEELKSRSATAKSSENNEIKINSTERADKGKWIMSKESCEFLALDEEVKKQLREGKKKRMQEVMDQMKFILDSDDISSTTGHWEKTGETDYYA